MLSQRERIPGERKRDREEESNSDEYDKHVAQSKRKADKEADREAEKVLIRERA